MLGIFRRFLPARPASDRHHHRVVPRLQALELRVVPTLSGNTLFPADNPWNQVITNAPVAANSDSLVNVIGANLSLHADFGTTYDGALNGIPYNVVSGEQPRVSVVIDAYASESDIVPIPIPDGAIIEGDPLLPDQNTGDRHMLVYDQDNNIVYETFNTHRHSETSDHQWHADSEAVWDLNQDTFRTAGFTSADAAGLPILPGLVRTDEVLDQGIITHALRFTVPRTQNAYVFPASHYAGHNDPTLPRMGERFRLRRDFDISGFSAANQVILQALKDYGMIIADNGSSWYLSGAPSERWSDADLHALARVQGSDFEAVDLTPQVTGVSPASGFTAGGDVVTITGFNFSGGAGLTQVFFGALPAPAFTIGDDNTITVTTPPNDPGTLDVTVVSPYGTSGIVAADQFTYAPALNPWASIRGLEGQGLGREFHATGTSQDGTFLPPPSSSPTAGQDAGDCPEALVVGRDGTGQARQMNFHGNPTFADADNGVSPENLALNLEIAVFRFSGRTVIAHHCRPVAAPDRAGCWRLARAISFSAVRVAAPCLWM
jgi:hypothetical protein